MDGQTDGKTERQLIFLCDKWDFGADGARPRTAPTPCFVEAKCSKFKMVAPRLGETNIHPVCSRLSYLSNMLLCCYAIVPAMLLNYAWFVLGTNFLYNKLRDAKKLCRSKTYVHPSL